MTVKILIKRQVPDHQVEALARMLRELRTRTMNQPGYISGETLQRVDRPGQTLVISTWASADHWRTWVLSPERLAIQEKIDDLLGMPTDYQIYTLGE